MAYRAAICDDCAADAQFVSEILKAWADERGAEVNAEIYPSAESFLFAYDENKAYDMLLLDIEMGGMDGVSMARRVRAGNKTVQIIFITGYSDYIAEGIVKQVPYYAAKIKLAHFKLNGNMRIYFHLYALGLGKGYFAVYYCIRHRVTRFYCQINRVQIGIQHIQIIVYAVHVALCRKRLQHLYMVAVIVPPAAHLAIHIVHLFIMRVYQLPLICGYALIYLP